MPNKKNKGIVPQCQDQRVKLVPVGCGNCIECRKQKAQAWRVRMLEEIKNDNKCYFVTLTFAPEELKKLCEETNKNECNAICAIAVRRFCERWRKISKKGLKHWLITEMGHKGTERIHMHGIIWTDKIEEVSAKWKYGIIDIGEYCNEQTINYIIKYVTKIDTEHKGYKPSIFCSKGIGKKYTDVYKNYHTYKTNETREYYTLNNGRKVNLPIYYRNKFFTEEEREKLWLEKLDKEEIYVLGTPISIKTKQDYESYLNILKSAQEYNTRIGYGDDTQQWKAKDYNITLKMLNNELKTKHNKNNTDDC